jgi:hypothetical protein
MRRTGWVLLAALLLCPGMLRAQEERLLTAVGGGMLGVAGGGYVALSIIVAESRAGRYIHDFDDVFGWRSLPVIAGGTLGTALGVYSPERLKRAVLFGFGGMAAGGVLGFGLGQLIWEGPEGKWAGAAIGAGAGLAISYIVGAITASGDDDIGQGSISVPVVIRVPLP